MPTIKLTQASRFSFFSIFLLLSLGSFYYGEDESDQETLPSSDSNADADEQEITNYVAFTAMDEEAMRVYREERRTELVESLSLSNLSAEHQELIASAIAKTYVGVPVSSFTFSSNVESSQEEDEESSITYHVRSTGHVQREDLEVYHSLDTNNPFMYFPPVPFVSETGKLLKESNSNATFQFDFEFPMDSEDEDEMMSEFADQMKWTVEITVSKVSEAPERLTISLAKPIRKRFLFKMTTIQMDFQFKYIDGCDCFAVSTMNMEMKGSALFVGKLDESVELTFTDISCEQPVRFLLPETTDSSFLMFE